MFAPDVTVISGFIDKADEAGNTGVAINNLDEGFQAIDNYKKQGYDQIKLYDGIKPEWIEALAQKTHSLGMRLAGTFTPFINSR